MRKQRMLILSAVVFMVFSTGCQIADGTKDKACASKATGVYNVLDYGAKGDGVTNDAKAIQAAIDACFEAGGGRVLLPGAKVYYSGSIVLKSGIEFHLARGAVLKASANVQDFIVVYKRPTEITPGFIIAREANDVTISGRGTIEGNGYAYMVEERPYIYRPKGTRPTMLCLFDCKHLTLQEITIRNAPCLTVHLLRCEDTLVDGIRILNDLKIPNCDGLHPDSCRNLRIANCYVQAGDDAIVLKNNSKFFNRNAPCENITITGCTLISTSAAFKIGTSSQGDFRNIVVDSCAIYGSNRGISIQVRDEGDIENMICSNIVIESQRFQEMWWGSGEPICVTYMPRNAETKIGTARNILFSNILCKSENGIFIHGWEGKGIENLVFDNVRVEIGKKTQWPGGWYDTRPSVISRVSPGSNAGIYCKWAKDVTFRNTSIVWSENPADYFGSALEAHSVEGLNLENFTGVSAHPDKYPDKVID